MRVRTGVGIAASLFLIVSSAAHGMLGWPAMMRELAKTDTPPELTRGLEVGWLFGSVCMVTFGVLLTRLFARRWRRLHEDPAPVYIIALGYLAFGLWALQKTDFDPFYAVFIVPALLLLFAATGRDRA